MLNYKMMCRVLAPVVGIILAAMMTHSRLTIVALLANLKKWD